MEKIGADCRRSPSGSGRLCSHSEDQREIHVIGEAQDGAEAVEKPALASG